MTAMLVMGVMMIRKRIIRWWPDHVDGGDRDLDVDHVNGGDQDDAVGEQLVRWVEFSCRPSWRGHQPSAGHQYSQVFSSSICEYLPAVFVSI